VKSKIAILFMFLVCFFARPANASEDGIGENYPVLRTEHGRAVVYFIDNRVVGTGFRRWLDDDGTFRGKRERCRAIPDAELRHSFGTRTITDVGHYHSTRMYVVEGLPGELGRVTQFAHEVVGISETWNEEDARRNMLVTVDLSFLLTETDGNSIKSAAIGTAVHWTSPNASEIVATKDQLYVAWMRAVPVSTDEAMMRSHGESSLIVDLVLTRWTPKAARVDETVLERDTPGLARLSMLKQGERLIIARDGEPPLIRMKAVRISDLHFTETNP
jgi:hypothetical protein